MHFRLSRRIWRSLGIVLLLGPALVGCGRESDSDQAPMVTLKGTSSTFATQAYYRWFNQLTVSRNINAEITPVGSSESLRRFLAGGIDFAGSEIPPSDAEFIQAPQGLLAFPVTAGAIAIAYNMPGCVLQLSRQQLVDLFMGSINNFAQLGCSSHPIMLLHRSDGSGSTASLSGTLASISPAWRAGPGVGRLVKWPAGAGVRGSDAMAVVLQSIPGSVGYLDAAYVREPLQAASLMNRSGLQTQPKAEAVAQALETFQFDAHLRGHDPDPPRGYPIVTLNWMLVPTRGPVAVRRALHASLTYILSREGQNDAERLGYLPLPTSLLKRGMDQLQQLER